MSPGQLTELLAILDFVLFLLGFLMLLESAGTTRWSCGSASRRSKSTSKGDHGLMGFFCWSTDATLSFFGALIVPVYALLLGHIHKLSRCVLFLDLNCSGWAAAATFHAFTSLQHPIIGRSYLIQTDQRGSACIRT